MPGKKKKDAEARRLKRAEKFGRRFPIAAEASAELAESLVIEYRFKDGIEYQLKDGGGGATNTAAARLIEPTASATDRFLGCSWPWGKPATDNVVGYEARFGLAFHTVLEAHLRHRGRGADKIISRIAKKAAKHHDVDGAEVDERVNGALPVLRAFLAGDNQWSISFDAWGLAYEVALAYNVVTGTARGVDLPTADTHEYLDRLPGEIPGTFDLLGASHEAVLVVDHKSGFDVGSPIESGQLLTLALAAARNTDADHAFVAFMHAPKGTAASVYADRIDKETLDRHASALLEAHGRRGSGTLRPDFYCKWCRAYSACPTNRPALVELRGKSALKTPEDVGAAYERLREHQRRFEAMADIVDAEIRHWIRENGDAICPSGREVGFVERPFTRLSQQSIVDALGKVAGGRMIEKLRKLGAIESGTRKELRVK
jgi:hypothetical protein